MDNAVIMQACMAFLGIFCAGIGFAVRMLYDKLSKQDAKFDKQDDALNDHKIMIARDYLPRAEMAAVMTNIDKRLDKMEQWIGRRFDMIMGRPATSKEE